MQQARGFTLIELVIVVAIVAILTAVAMPSYLSQVAKGNRQDAMGALVVFAQAMERLYTTDGTYIGADGGTSAITKDTAPTIFPTQAPIDSSNKRYNLFIRASTATTYTIVAVPIANDRMDGDGAIGLLSTGQRWWDRDDDGNVTEASDLCWDKSC